MSNFSYHIKWSFLTFVLISEILLLIGVLNNPRFLDSLSGFLVFFIILPILAGIIFGFFLSFLPFLLKRFFRSAVSVERLAILINSFLIAFSLSIFFLFWLFGYTLVEFSSISIILLLYLSIVVLGGITAYMIAKNIFTKTIHAKNYILLPLIYVSLLLLIIVSSLSPRLFNHKGVEGEEKVLLLGFDGASWNVIAPLIEKGEMPNLKRLMAAGSYGNFRTARPIYSPLIWNTIISGKTYEKHGVIDFSCPSYAVKSSRLWDIFESKGSSIGLCGYYQTWPPWQTNGFIIPEIWALGPETFPPHLKFIRELYMTAKKKRIAPVKAVLYGFLTVKNGLRLSTLKLATQNFTENIFHRKEYYNLDDYYKKRILILNMYSDIYTYLINKFNPDFSVFLSKLPDNVSHIYWKYMEPEKFDTLKKEEVARYGDVIPLCYREMDKAIGKIMEFYDERTTVFLVSDHGFEATVKLDKKKSVYYISSEKLLKHLQIENKTVGTHEAENVHIRILADFIDETDNIIELFSSITFKETGNPVFVVTKLMPGLIQLEVDSNEEGVADSFINIKDDFINFSEIADESYVEEVSGKHAINGTIVMKGPNIKQNHRVKEASIFDVVPTLLYLLGLPVGEDMDGKVLQDAIDDMYLSRNILDYIPTYDSLIESRKYKEQKLDPKLLRELKSLGYIR